MLVRLINVNINMKLLPRSDGLIFSHAKVMQLAWAQWCFELNVKVGDANILTVTMLTC